MIHGLMVARNEEHRYLEASLKWNSRLFDTLSFVDDKSTDNTLTIAEGYVDHWVGGLQGSFTVNEGLFREEAWAWWVQQVDSESSDWLVSVDADEFITGDLATALSEHKADDASLKVYEVWDTDPVVVRVDEYWGRGLVPRCVRASRIVDEMDFRHDKRFGSGSLPRRFRWSQKLEGSELVHFGYARAEDREAKHARYHGVSGHGPRHIASIKTHPTLVEWNGEEIEYE